MAVSITSTNSRIHFNTEGLKEISDDSQKGLQRRSRMAYILYERILRTLCRCLFPQKIEKIHLTDTATGTQAYYIDTASWNRFLENWKTQQSLKKAEANAIKKSKTVRAAIESVVKIQKKRNKHPIATPTPLPKNEQPSPPSPRTSPPHLKKPSTTVHPERTSKTPPPEPQIKQVNSQEYRSKKRPTPPSHHKKTSSTAPPQNTPQISPAKRRKQTADPVLLPTPRAEVPLSTPRRPAKAKAISVRKLASDFSANKYRTPSRTSRRRPQLSSIKGRREKFDHSPATAKKKRQRKKYVKEKALNVIMPSIEQLLQELRIPNKPQQMSSEISGKLQKLRMEPNKYTGNDWSKNLQKDLKEKLAQYKLAYPQAHKPHPGN